MFIFLIKKGLILSILFILRSKREKVENVNKLSSSELKTNV